MPNNGSPTPSSTYQATFNTAGSPYTVTLNSDITVSGLTLNSSAATISHTAGTLNLSGDLTLSAGTFRIAGGRVKGGTIYPSATGPLNIVGGGFFDGVTLAGDLNLAGGTSLSILGGFTATNSTLSLAADSGNASLAFTSSQNFGGNGTVVFNGSTSSNYVVPTANGPDPQATLTVGAGITIRTGTQGGQVGVNSFPGLTVVNKGVISAQTAGKTLTLYRFSGGDGTLSATAGGHLIASLASGDVGTVTVGTGGQVDIDGSAMNFNRPVAVTGNSLLGVGGTWTNAGGITVTNSTLNIAGSSSALGSISLNNSVLNVNGTFTTAQIQSIAATGSSITVGGGGNLVNTGNTIAISPTSSFWKMAGGKITGGTISSTGGTQMIVSKFGTNTLDGVTFDVDLTVQDGGTLVIANQAALNGHRVSLAGNGNSTRMSFYDPANRTFSGTGEIVLDGGMANTVDSLYGGTLTLDPGLTVRTGTGGGTFGSSSTSLVNKSLFSARTAARALTLTGVSVSNQGTLEAINGGTLVVNHLSGNIGNVTLNTGGQLDLDGTYVNEQSRVISDGATLILRGSWSNPGGIAVSNGTLAFVAPPVSPGSITFNNGTLGIAGAFTTAQALAIPRTNTGLAVLPGGTINNAGTTLAPDANTPFLQLRGGTISGGTIAAAPAGTMVSAAKGDSTLAGVTLAADLLLQDSVTVTMTGGLTLSAGRFIFPSGAASASLIASGTQSWGGTGEIVVNALASIDPGSGTLTLGPGITVRGASGLGIFGKLFSIFGGGGTVVNQGIVTVGTAAVVDVGNAPFTNVGLVEARNGGKFGSATTNVTVTNLVNGKLTGGTWAVYDGSTMYPFGSKTVTNNSATIILSGATSVFDPIKPLVTNAGSFTVTDGRAFTTVGALSNTGTIAVGPAATVNVAGILSGAGSATVDATGLLTATAVRQATLSLGGRAVIAAKAQGGDTSVLKTLMIAGSTDIWTGQFDLADTALIVDYTGESPSEIIAAQVRSGRHGGDWAGNGITSSAAAANPAAAVGYVEASELLGIVGGQTGSFAGQVVDATAVLVRYTLRGDANLDGTVGFDDLVRLAQNYDGFPGGGGAWYRGDFNYDGHVDFEDLVAIAQNYDAAVPGAIPAAQAAFAADWSAAIAVAPEPASMLFPASVAALMATGRRRPRGHARPWCI